MSSLHGAEVEDVVVFESLCTRLWRECQFLLLWFRESCTEAGKRQEAELETAEIKLMLLFCGGDLEGECHG